MDKETNFRFLFMLSLSDKYQVNSIESFNSNPGIWMAYLILIIIILNKWSIQLIRKPTVKSR